MSKIADHVIPFAVKPLGVRGRLVRLGPVVDDILSKHDYPDAISALVAESVALTAMLGSALKFDGKFILQTKTDGPAKMIVADFYSPGLVRGMAKFDSERLGATTQAELLGEGLLAMTVDQGQDMERYQGLVPLNKNSLAEATHTYFLQSEQIPTQLRVAAGPLITRGHDTAQWRAGSIMVQYVPSEGGVDAVEPDDDHWVKAKALMGTVEDHELLDPSLSGEDLLYRLFHEDGVTVYPAIPIKRHCTCSLEAVETMVRGFPPDDRAAMVKDGAIEVVCEFCSTPYRFNPAALG